MYKELTRTALFLAVVLLFQSLRFFIPIPPFFSTFLIGSLVNASLFLSVSFIGLTSSFFIAVLAPTIAYFQQLLPLPVFIIPVALGNIALISLFKAALPFNAHAGIILASVGKTAVLYGSFTYLLTFIDLPTAFAAALMLLMSWPQLVTGCLGGILSLVIGKKLKAFL